MHGRRRRITVGGIGLALGLGLAPATANAAGLIAAYDHYVPGKGFEIGLKDAQTGATLSLPAGVNTNDDEVHPALSRDGRYIVFARMTLLPGLNGDFVPPENRTLQRVDRQTGAITQFSSGKVAGPSFVRGRNPTSGSITNNVSWGNRIAFFDGERSHVSQHMPIDAANNPTGPHFFNVSPVDTTGGNLIETTHAAVDGGASESGGRDRLLLTLAYIDRTTGALVKSLAHLGLNVRQPGTSLPLQALRKEFGNADTPASHPVARAGDQTVAFAMGAAGNSDIHTTTLPNGGVFSVPTPTPAPAAINTSADEQMPTWSPDDLKLGFVRTTAGRRKLAVFDATPGIQSVLNPPVDIGPEAPTPQTRSFQAVWGGLSMAEAAQVDPPAPATTCSAACLAALQPPPGATVLQPVSLQPVVKTPGTKPLKIGILVARVTGKRKLLGRTVPKLRVVGRVPLGRVRNGTNRFRWNRRVAGKRLERGTYVLTFRTLKGEIVTSTSNSVRFTVAKSGRVTRVKRQR
jgi:hypothetical protein